MSDVTESYFAELLAAIGNATTVHLTGSAAALSTKISNNSNVRSVGYSPPTPHSRSDASPARSAVALVSTHIVPAPDDGGELYETTRLLSYGAQDVAKSEFVTGKLPTCLLTVVLGDCMEQQLLTVVIRDSIEQQLLTVVIGDSIEQQRLHHAGWPRDSETANDTRSQTHLDVIIDQSTVHMIGGILSHANIQTDEPK
jgi:hypothetical protein